jgi:hypothetical protein
MRSVIKSAAKAVTQEAQRRYYWSLTPYERLALAQRLNEQARRIAALNPANPALPDYGRRVFKATAPVSRRRG